MRNDEKVGRFNRNLDAMLRGEQPDEADPLLDLARTLGQMDLGPRSRQRQELRRRFQFRPQPVLPRQDRLGWQILALLQAGPASRLIASALVLVLLSSFLAIFSLPGRPAWSPAPSGATAPSISASSSQRALLSPQPIPTPQAPLAVASTVPVMHTDLPGARLSPTQIYTRQAPQQSTRWRLDNKP